MGVLFLDFKKHKKMDLDFLKITKNWLCNLEEYKRKLDTYEMAYEDLDNDDISISSANLSVHIKKKDSYRVFSYTEKNAIDLTETRAKLLFKIAFCKRRIEMIEFYLNKLDKNESEMLKLRYVSSYKVSEIADKYHYNYEYTGEKLRRTLKKLRDMMFKISKYRKI